MWYKRTGRMLAGVIFALLAGLLATPTYAQQIDQVFAEGGTDHMTASGVAADSAGNRYVIGIFRGEVTFGTGVKARRLTATGQEDAFVAKYDQAGNLVWVQQDSSSAPLRAKAVAVDGGGRLYVAGEYSAIFAFDRLRMESANPAQDGFLMKLNPANGASEWVARVNSPDSDSAHSLAIDSGGNALITGRTGTIVTANSTGLVTRLTVDAGGRAFLAKHDPLGVVQWLRGIDGPGAAANSRVAVFASDGVCLVGSFINDITIRTLNRATTLRNRGSTDVFIATYSRFGGLVKAQSAGSTGADEVNDVKTASLNCYLAGSFERRASFGGQI
jgi:hypothetical protein